MEKRKRYTKEFKEGTVRLVTERGRSITDAAKCVGMSAFSLSRCAKAAQTEGTTKLIPPDAAIAYPADDLF
jgi:transposase-like protein